MKTRVNFCRCTQQSSLLSTGFTLKSQGSTGSCPSRAWLVAFTAFFNDRRETIFVILISEEGAVFLRKLGVTKICSEFVLCAIAVTLRNIMWQQFFFSVIGLWKNPQCWVAIGFIVGVSWINFLLNRLWWSVTSMLLFQRHFRLQRCVHYSLLAAVPGAVQQQDTAVPARSMNGTLGRGNTGSCAQPDGCRWKGIYHSCQHLLPQDEKSNISRNAVAWSPRYCCR